MIDGKTKTVSAEFKADGGKGEFTAVFSVFDVLDRDGDIVRKGAFLPAFENDPTPPVVWTHRWDIPPIGETLDASESDEGAVGKGRLFVDDHPVAAQVYTAMKAGALKQYSYAYEIAEGGFILRDATDDEKTPRWDDMVRELTEFSAIFEWGPTLAGANPETYTAQDPKSLELLLGIKQSDMRAWLGLDVDDDDFAKMLALAKDLNGSKRGARNSSKDGERLQTIHDLAVENGATCKAEEPDENDDENDDDEGKARKKAVSDLLTAGRS